MVKVDRANPMILSVSLLLIAMFSIQYGASLAKQLFPEIGAEGATSLRLIFAALMLCMLWQPWKVKLARKQLLAILVYGISLGAMNFTFYLALERLPLGIAVAIEFIGPLTVAFASSRKPLDFLWAILAVGGILMILPISQTSTALDPVGVLFALIAGGCWASYILFGRKVGSSVHGGTATSLGMLAAACFVSPIGVARVGAHLFSWSILPIALAVAVFSSAVPYSLEMVALKKLPAKTFGILMSLEPAIGAFLGLLYLKENLTPQQWLAIGCIVLASFGSSASAQQELAS